MRIFLRGGRFDGKFREVPESERQFVEEGQVYVTSPEKTNEGAQVFKFDNVATEKRKSGGKVEPPQTAGKFQPSDKIGAKGEAAQKIAGKVEPMQNVKGKAASTQPKQRT